LLAENEELKSKLQQKEIVYQQQLAQLLTSHKEQQLSLQRMIIASNGEVENLKKELDQLRRKEQEKERVISSVVRSKTEQENLIEQLKKEVDFLKQDNFKLKKDSATAQSKIDLLKSKTVEQEHDLLRAKQQTQSNMPAVVVNSKQKNIQTGTQTISPDNIDSSHRQKEVQQQPKDKKVESVARVKAMFDYEAAEENELTLKGGVDIVTVLAKDDSGWWKGELYGRVGLFPANFVEDFTAEPVDGANRSDSSTITGSAVIVAAQPPVQHLRVRVAFDYEPKEDNELLLKAGEIVQVLDKDPSGWWTGSIGDRRGLFPENFVVFIDEDSDMVEAPIDRVKALFEYEAKEDNELSFHIGDVIDVFKKDPSGWWTGELNGRIGLFAENFMEVIGRN